MKASRPVPLAKGCRSSRSLSRRRWWH